MSLLNTDSDGNYPELIVLSRLILQEKKLQEQRLLDLCSAGAVLDQKLLRSTLFRWKGLGLFDSDQDSVVSLAGSTRGLKASELVDWLQKRCLLLALGSDQAMPLWGKDNGLSADFVRALSWLLCQDIYRFVPSWEYVQELEGLQMKPDFRVIQNDTRWQGLQRWTRFLGLASGNGKTFRIDPTQAVRRALPLIFEKANEIPVLGFVSTLSQELPVLDNGRYRQEVEESMQPNAWPKPPSTLLSMSLSFALQRLNNEGVIKLEHRADANQGIGLSGQGLRTWEQVTHVCWSREKQ